MFEAQHRLNAHEAHDRALAPCLAVITGNDRRHNLNLSGTEMRLISHSAARVASHLQNVINSIYSVRG